MMAASKPNPTETMKSRKGRGMKSGSSYVGVRKRELVGLKELALFGSGEVDTYRLVSDITEQQPPKDLGNSLYC